MLLPISTLILIALSFTTSCLAATAMKQMESVSKAALAQQGWSLASTPSSLETITLQIGLTLQNTPAMINKLLDVSSRKSRNYGKWLDRDEVNRMVKPSVEANNAVRNWLQGEGVRQLHSDETQSWITFTANIGTVNRILNAEFQRYKSSDGEAGAAKIRTTTYSVPEDIAEHIDIIHPTTFFGKSGKTKFAPVHVRFAEMNSTEESHSQTVEKRQDTPYTTTQQTVAAACRTEISPSCLKQLYNVGNYSASANSGARIGFGSFLNQSASYRDLELFIRNYSLPAHNFTKVFVNPSGNPKNPGSGEANLDVQNIVGLAYPLPIVEYLTGGSPPFIPDNEMRNASENSNEPYVPYYQYLLSKRNSELPQVISNSYGEPEQTVPRRYAERTCTMIAMMGLRGISILESSGDTGIGSSCKSNDGTERAKFDNQFPSGCPWITSVGGTEAVNPEIAWRDSSGGFSDYFGRPAYQSDIVDSYLVDKYGEARLKIYGSYFNRQGRGFPDISAHSLLPDYGVFGGGRKVQSGGTSAASPVVASLIALLNDARFKAGLSSVGFLNPWLYESGNEFLIDIVSGAGRGCEGVNNQAGRDVPGGKYIPGAFWNATVGWDPVTGLGIPDFQKMVQSSIGDDEEEEEDDDDDAEFRRARISA